MAKFKDSWFASLLGGVVKTALNVAIPGISILANIKADNNESPGKYDASKTWQNVAIELGRIVLYILALKFLGIDIGLE